MLRTLRFIHSHPLCRADRLGAMVRFVRWQLATRAFPAGYVVDFAGGARLLVRRGMAGATGNIYTGLHEFEEMGFTAHCLEPGDLFVDAGANVGAYTVLAAKARGANCLAIEPVPGTYATLCENIRLNDIMSLVEAVQGGVADKPGTLRFTSGEDTTNHVAASGESGIEVTVSTIDTLLAGRVPTVIKVDVEGFEVPMLEGAADTLSNPGLLAVLLETNGSGVPYGFSDEDIHTVMSGHGFTPCQYEPWTRSLEILSGPRPNANTIYVRDPEGLAGRLRSAKPIDVAGQKL